ncbi:MAG TPA: nitroreductase [Candidatus Tidjanibacter gallistercoris]|nr:nitroreductase [Candidatus Tidjanibacter gallistercoris]
MNTFMNVVLENMKTRRSIRGYDPDRMPAKELIERVAEAGTYAPTGMGMQAPRIVAVTNGAVRDRLSALNAAVMGTASDPFYGAPAVLVVLADRSRPTYLYDGSLVMGNLLNAAYAVGLGSCWIHRAKEVFDSPEGKALLQEWGIEGDYEGIGHCVLGYPLTGAAPEAKPRKADYVVWVE